MERKVFGAEPFSNWKEKDTIIKRLRREFNNKVKLRTEGNIVLYEHYGSFGQR